MPKRECSINNCNRTAKVFRMCNAHYHRVRAHGDAMADIPLMDKPKNLVHPFGTIDYPDGTRQCQSCGERKNLEDFHVTKNALLGRHKACKVCRNKVLRDRRQLQPEQTRAYDRKKSQWTRDDRIERLRARRAQLRGKGNDLAITKRSLRSIDGDECAYCGRALDFAKRKNGEMPRNLATIDHIVPVSRGGTSTWD